jgi:hypothetical protein
MLEEMQKIGLEMNDQIMKGISQQQQHELARVLHVMKENLLEMDVVPGAKARRNTASMGDQSARPLDRTARS